MNQNERYQMMNHEVLHSRDDHDRLYLSRKGNESRLASIEDSVDSSIRGLEIYIKRRDERTTTVTRNSTDNIKTNRKNDQ